MTFTFSFKPQLKSEQKIDFAQAKDLLIGQLEKMETVEKLDIGVIVEKAMDDLTGASHRMDDEADAMELLQEFFDSQKGTGSVLDPDAPAVDPEVLDSFGNSDDGSGGNGGNGGGSDEDNPNDFDGTTGDAPSIPPNPSSGSNDQQQNGGSSSTTPGGYSDPTDPTNDGCGDDYDYRPNPEDYKDYGSLSTVNLKELVGGNEMDLVLNSMSVDTMGM